MLRLRSMISVSVLVAILAMGLAACGLINPPAAPTAQTGEKAGQITVKYSPVQPNTATPTAPPPPAEPPNLMNNGNLNRWGDQIHTPDGWFHAWGYPDLKLAPSTLEAVTGSDAFEGKSAKQTWTKADAAGKISTLFGTTVSDLEPNTDYRLLVRAKNAGDALVHVSIFGFEGDNPDENPERLFIFDIKKGPDFQVSEASFHTGKYSKVRIVVGAPETSNTFPVTVIWDDFKVWKIGKSSE